MKIGRNKTTVWAATFFTALAVSFLPASTAHAETKSGDGWSYDFYVCIPVLPEQAPEDAVAIPACTALSLLFYGNYSNLNEAHLYLGEQVRKRRLTPTGYIRASSLVGPYVGREIDPNKYCSQLVLPVADDPSLQSPISAAGSE